MTGRWGDVRSLADVVVAPRAAFANVATRTPLGTPLAALGVLQAILLAWQAVLLQPALLADPWLGATADDAPGLLGRYWLVRGVTIALWPVSCVLRGAALATVLQCAGVLAGAGLAWRRLLSLTLYVDLVFWIEGMAINFLLAAHPATNQEELRGLRLHAGLDLIWQPDSQRLCTFLEAANAFTLWWAALVGLGLVHCLGLGKWRAAAIAATVWAALVGLRCLFATT